MLVFHSAREIEDHLSRYKSLNNNSLVGFVPTMGALHEGHMRLISEAKKNTDLVVASVFVNPTQFNDPKDLERYPRTPEKDQELLQANGCDVLYMPSVEDIYPAGTQNYEIDFNGLDLVMEGKFRPGHFKGVAQVVERFFSIVKPHVSFFGRKDFQQVSIIKHLVKVRNLGVQISVVETARSPKGLALSSRNTLLSESERDDALILFKTLDTFQKEAQNFKNPRDFEKHLTNIFNQGKLKLEYLEIVNDETLQPCQDLSESCTCCIAAFCGPVRLIDNMPLNAS